MKINFAIDWNSMDWQQYDSLLLGGRAQINENKLSTLPPDFTGWTTQSFILLPVRITKNNSFTDTDVIGEITEVLVVNTVKSKYNVRLKVKMLKPYSL